MVGVASKFRIELLLILLTHNNQSKVAPYGGIFVPMKFYADGTQAYKFRGKTFHPFVLRLPSLPSYIRNGEGKGGGVLVGYVPEVSFTLCSPFTLTCNFIFLSP
jgi:hypothetical protein